MSYRKLSEVPEGYLTGKNILVRVDFNVPVKDGKVKDDTRIRAFLPTLRFLLEKNPKKITLASHLGRPEGAPDPKYSMRPVCDHLKSLINEEVFFIEDIPTGIDNFNKTNYKIYVLENTRFYPGETKNTPEFSKILAQYGDVFVEDAFGSVHRAHASTVGVTQFIKDKFIGLLVEKEVLYLEKVRENPDKPFVVILGGAKVSDKLGVIENLVKKSDYILVGGGMVYTFLKAKGLNVGDSIVEEGYIENVKKLLDTYGEKFRLAKDHIIAKDFKEDVEKKVSTGDIPSGYKGGDIGPETIKEFEEILEKAKTVFWNGPLGVFEVKGFERGSYFVAQKMKDLTKKGVTTVIGGGDTLRALREAGVGEEEVTHASTGGGATLEFLAGIPLPGLEAIRV